MIFWIGLSDLLSAAVKHNNTDDVVESAGHVIVDGVE